jgi:hypothetical protein
MKGEERVNRTGGIEQREKQSGRERKKKLHITTKVKAEKWRNNNNEKKKKRLFYDIFNGFGD